MCNCGKVCWDVISINDAVVRKNWIPRCWKLQLYSSVLSGSCWSTGNRIAVRESDFRDCSKNMSVFLFFPTLLKVGSTSFECAKGIQSNALLHLLLKAVMRILGTVRHLKNDMCICVGVSKFQWTKIQHKCWILINKWELFVSTSKHWSTALLQKEKSFSQTLNSSPWLPQ